MDERCDDFLSHLVQRPKPTFQTPSSSRHREGEWFLFIHHVLTLLSADAVLLDEYEDPPTPLKPYHQRPNNHGGQRLRPMLMWSHVTRVLDDPVDWLEKNLRVLSVEEFPSRMRTQRPLDTLRVEELRALVKVLHYVACQSMAARRVSRQALTGPRAGAPSARDRLLCPICTDQDVNQVLDCGHAFCGTCLRGWVRISPECPICKREWNRNVDIYI